jgi:hypothetical protein
MLARDPLDERRSDIDSEVLGARPDVGDTTIDDVAGDIEVFRGQEGTAGLLEPRPR